MNAIFSISTSLLLFTLSAFGRVGETQQEVSARYGQGNKSGDRLTAPGAETWKYSKAGLSIEVIFLNGKSVWEVFQRQDKVISDDDIKALLKLYDTPSTTWHLARKDNRWERSGKPKLVGYRWPGHSDYFCIKDIEACDAAEKKGKLDATGL